MAHVERFGSKRTACIVLRRPGNGTRDSWPHNPVEYTIIHELLHISMLQFEPPHDTPQWQALEAFVHQTAVTLLTLDRRRKL